MTIEEFANSGIVERACKSLHANEDVKQEVYLAIFNKCERDGSQWLSMDWIEGYVWRMCRNMLFNPSSPYNVKFRNALIEDGEIPDEPDELNCISDRLDDKLLLDDVMEFIDKRHTGEDGWYKRGIFWGWLEAGSYRNLEKEILEYSGYRISYQSISLVVRELIHELENHWLPSKGWKLEDGTWKKRNLTK